MKAVQCSACKQWVHKDCDDISDELFTVLSGKYGAVSWQCQACQAGVASLNAQIAAMSARLIAVEQRLNSGDERATAVDNRLDKLEAALEAERAKATRSREDTVKVVFEELRDREEKLLNIVIHNIGEPVNDDNMVLADWDAASFDNIMAAMRVNLSYAECANFSKRLGRKGKNPRPLLVCLKQENQKKIILENAKHLSTTEFRTVQIVPDLTKQQREADKKLREEATEKNRTELTPDDIAKNLRWVTVGKKGARKLVKKEVRPDGHPNQQHNSRKRARQDNGSPGNKRARGGPEEEEEDQSEEEMEAAGGARVRTDEPPASTTA